MTQLTISEVAGYIDHTLLKPETTGEDIARVCREAISFNFYAVCINPCHVVNTRNLLEDSGIKIATVVGFPLGSNLASTKIHESEFAVQEGADELDMVMNIGALREGDHKTVEKDIQSVVNAVNKSAVVKVIIETALLTDEEKKIASKIVESAGANYVKTSTGFNGGATLDDVRLIRSVISSHTGIKASGGIKTYADCVGFIEAGANRIGTSSGTEIIRV